MLPEISLGILDIAQNSIKAEASLIEICIDVDSVNQKLLFQIRDNGCGMNDDQLKGVVDPFFTSRTTRKVGLGVPFMKQSAECTGGSFRIESTLNKGTVLEATFNTDHIDCMPLGDITETVLSLITMNEAIDFVYTYSYDKRAFTLDTREIREIIGDIPFSTPDVREFLRNYLNENKFDVECTGTNR